MGLVAVSWLGTLPAWLTFMGVIGAAWAVWRGGGGTALSTLQTANRVLEERVHELELQGKRDAATIAELTGKTDLALAIKPFMEWASTHEERAVERHAGTLKVLDLIAERLGPDG